MAVDLSVPGDLNIGIFYCSVIALSLDPVLCISGEHSPALRVRESGGAAGCSSTGSRDLANS